MRIGVTLGFGNLRDDMTDAQMLRAEAQLALRVEELGFDAVWAVEQQLRQLQHVPGQHPVPHVGRRSHGTDQDRDRRRHLALARPAAGRREDDRARHPVRGPCTVRNGSGLSGKEYAPLRVDMGESRERFDEAAAMILGALETGVIAGNGPFYVQPEVELRPRPESSFADRVYCVANSEDSSSRPWRRRAGCWPSSPVRSRTAWRTSWPTASSTRRPTGPRLRTPASAATPGTTSRPASSASSGWRTPLPAMRRPHWSARRTTCSHVGARAPRPGSLRAAAGLALRRNAGGAGRREPGALRIPVAKKFD